MKIENTTYLSEIETIENSSIFLKLKKKTQLFTNPCGKEIFTTRYTHTKQVEQVALAISSRIGGNQELVRAIALSHDIGHSPYGHQGENVLFHLCKRKFRHERNGARIAWKLGLDSRVGRGIWNHSSLEKCIFLEEQIVCFADKIAYINSDIEDCIQYGVLKREEIPDSIREVFPGNREERVAKAVNSLELLDEKLIMKEPFFSQLKYLKQYILTTVYQSGEIKKIFQREAGIVAFLFRHLKEHSPEFGRHDLLICDYLTSLDNDEIEQLYRRTLKEKIMNLAFLTKIE